MPNALIIDDNPSNILVLQQLLNIEGVQVARLSSTANLAAELSKHSDIDVVFLDLEMPGMNGYEAVSIVKAHPNFKDTRVVAYSVHVSELTVVLDKGFDGFLGKPLSAESFPDQLTRILAGEQVLYLP